MRPARIVLIALACALSWPAHAEDEGRVTLLVTHPTRGVLENVIRLRDQGLLSPQELEIVGVHAADDAARYRRARRFLTKTRPASVRIEAVACDPGDGIARATGCDEAFERLFAGSAGIIFSGGADLPPRLYGEETLLTTVIQTPLRHRLELAFVRRLLTDGADGGHPALLAARPTYLVMGICLGMQTLNVALGGTLVQDIPSEIYGLSTLEQVRALPADERHRSAARLLEPDMDHRGDVAHRVRFTPAAREALGLPASIQEPAVLSYHHQAAERLGADLGVWARSMDGKIIEAVGHARFPAVLGVQFHPERAFPPPAAPEPDPFTRHLWRWVSDRLAASR
jgi:putative glutamine amidotransferase